MINVLYFHVLRFFAHFYQAKLCINRLSYVKIICRTQHIVCHAFVRSTIDVLHNENNIRQSCAYTVICALCGRTLLQRWLVGSMHLGEFGVKTLHRIPMLNLIHNRKRIVVLHVLTIRNSLQRRTLAKLDTKFLKFNLPTFSYLPSIYANSNRYQQNKTADAYDNYYNFAIALFIAFLLRTVWNWNFKTKNRCELWY